MPRPTKAQRIAAGLATAGAAAFALVRRRRQAAPAPDADLAGSAAAPPLQLSQLAGLRAHLERLPWAVSLYDSQLRFVYLNPAAEEMFGYTTAEVVGKTAMGVILPPEYSDELATATAGVQRGEIVRERVANIRKDGTRILCEWHVTPLTGPDDALVGVLGVARDVTQEQEALQDLALRSTIVGFMSDAVIAVDLDHRITYFNAAAESMFGWRANEVLGRYGHEILQTEGAHERRERFSDRLDRGEVTRATLVQRHRDGHTIDVDLTGYAMRDASGRISGYVTVIRDVSAQRQAAEREHRLQHERDELLQRFQLQLDRMPLGVILMDEDFRLTYWNPAAADVFGWTLEDVRAKRPAEILFAEGERPFVEELFRRIGAGETFTHRLHVGVARDGREILCEWHNTPLHSNGRFTGLMSIVQDVTERERGIEAQRESEERLRAILDATVDGIITIDEQGTIESMNPAAEAIFGYKASEIIGQSARMLMPDAYAIEQDETLSRYLQSGSGIIRGIQAPGLRKDGTVFPVELGVSDLRIDGERRFTAVVRDITERKQLESQLIESQKMETVGRLAGGIAHDFNNLLTAIIGNVDLALDELPDGSAGREDLQEVRLTAERAAGLTRQLLAFSRRQVVEPRVVDLDEVVTGAERLLRRVIPEDVALVVELRGDGAQTEIDPGQLEQVLLNIVINARDAMPSGGRVALTTGRRRLDHATPMATGEAAAGEYATIAVGDTGEGITDEARPHIFEPFFTTKEVGKGTGLGLATAYGIVRQAGGNIDVMTAPGGGSTFTILLPVTREAATTAPSRATPAGDGRGTETVLLVEDEPSVRRLSARVLRERGYEVLEAADGLEALEASARHRGTIDLLLTDVVMPHLGGRDLAERLRAVRPEMRQLFTSGHTEDGAFLDGPLADGAAFLQKPYSSMVLARKVREVLDHGRKPAEV